MPVVYVSLSICDFNPAALKPTDCTLFVKPLSKSWFPLQVPFPPLFSPLLPHA
jgi:hypothetical protein